VRLDAKIAAVERDCHVDVALFGTLNDQHGLRAAAGLIEGGVCAFKFSTFEAAPNRFPRVDEDVLYEAFRLIAPAGLACSVHNQMQELTRKNIQRMTDDGDTDRRTGTRRARIDIAWVRAMQDVPSCRPSSKH
jgi:allantoinase